MQALAGAARRGDRLARDLAAMLARARVAVAPMRYGAGLKLKTVEAMAHGVPVVSTALGAEGLGGTERLHLLVADEPHEIAAAIAALLADDELWRRLSDRGRAHVRDRYCGRRSSFPQLEALLAPQPSR